MNPLHRLMLTVLGIAIGGVFFHSYAHLPPHKYFARLLVLVVLVTIIIAVATLGPRVVPE